MLLRRWIILLCCLTTLDLFGSTYRSSSSSRSYSSSSSRSSSSSKSYSSSSKSSKPSSKSYSSSSSSSSSTSTKPKFSFFGKAEKAQAKVDSADKYKARSQQSYEYLRSQPRETYKTRETRQRNIFKNYYARPATNNTNVQASGFNPFFWMWLMDNVSHQATWTYHHKDQLSDAQYKELLAKNKDLEAKIKEMEEKKIPKDPNYSPDGVDKDLMYSDEYVKNATKKEESTWPTAIAILLLAGISVSLLFIFRKRLF